MTPARHMPQERVIRYTFQERIVHWIAGVTYLYLLVSGLAFFLPVLYWLTYPLGGGSTARAWHPWAGVIFTISVVWMYRLWHREMRPAKEDRAWRAAIHSYITNDDARVPPAGRFNPGQKSLFWLMFYGGVSLLLSGIVLWFPEYIASSPLRQIAILTHVSAALITIAGFIVHVYMGLAVVPGGFSAIVRGYVSEEWARAHHALWQRK
jgi:formate dehydrogenase subunit gamma